MTLVEELIFIHFQGPLVGRPEPNTGGEGRRRGFNPRHGIFA